MRHRINIRHLSIGLGLAIGVAIGTLVTHGWPSLAHAIGYARTGWRLPPW